MPAFLTSYPEEWKGFGDVVLLSFMCNDLLVFSAGRGRFPEARAGSMTSPMLWLVVYTRYGIHVTCLG